MERVISVCTVLGKEQYIQRHDTVCVELHCNMCKEIGGKSDNKQLYGHVQDLVRQSYGIMEPRGQTDRNILTINRTS